MKENFYAMPIAWQEKYERVNLRRPGESSEAQGEAGRDGVETKGRKENPQTPNKPIRELEKKAKGSATSITYSITQDSITVHTSKRE